VVRQIDKCGMPNLRIPALLTTHSQNLTKPYFCFLPMNLSCRCHLLSPSHFRNQITSTFIERVNGVVAIGDTPLPILGLYYEQTQLRTPLGEVCGEVPHNPDCL
jgi:hypothetical protein